MAVLFIHPAVMEQSDSADIDCWCKPSGTYFRPCSPTFHYLCVTVFKIPITKFTLKMASCWNTSLVANCTNNKASSSYLFY